MQLLEREDGLSRRKLDWTACNRSVTRYFMEHALAVVNAMNGPSNCHPDRTASNFSITSPQPRNRSNRACHSASPAQLPRLASSLTGYSA